MKQRTIEGVLALILFVATIPMANWMLGHVGTVCPPDSPCLIPVAPGVMSPSAVLMIGVALVLRDLVQRRLGKLWGLGAIFIGAAISAVLSPPTLVVASAAAFLLSELADFAVYTPLQRRGLLLAVFASGVVGLIIDSIVFLQLAFGSLDFLTGQVLGKFWMILLALPVLAWLRARDERLQLQPA